MGKEIPEGITGPESAGPLKPIKGDEEGKSPARSFESFMKEGGQEATGKTEGVSPLELPAGQTLQTTGVNMESILGQMNATSSSLGDIQKQLNTKNLKLKQSQKYLLRNKLTEANTHIRTVAGKLGTETGKPPSMMARQNPIAKFLALMNDGAEQMTGAAEQLKKIKMSGKNLNPGDMLLIQVKLAKAQQELEYSSVLLSKAVDDIKTLFQVQI